MAITATGNTTTANTTAATNTQGTIDKNTFLKLFTTQLQYQDPLNPMDASSFTTQLAQFSSLEQLTNVNNNLTSLLTSTSANLIGKQVTMKDGSTGKVTGVSFDGTNTNVMLDSNQSGLFTDITQISD